MGYTYKENQRWKCGRPWLRNVMQYLKLFIIGILSNISEKTRKDHNLLHPWHPRAINTVVKSDDELHFHHWLPTGLFCSSRGCGFFLLAKVASCFVIIAKLGNSQTYGPSYAELGKLELLKYNHVGIRVACDKQTLVLSITRHIHLSCFLICIFCLIRVLIFQVYFFPFPPLYCSSLFMFFLFVVCIDDIKLSHK